MLTGAMIAASATGATGAFEGAPGKPVRIEDLPPPARMGVRAESVRRAWPAASLVVIVPDEISYVRAISAWTPRARFPVLIDDGAELTREDIARFVRAYRPERILTWAAADDPGEPAAWPAELEKRRELVDGVVRRVWSIRSPDHPPQNKAELTRLWGGAGAPPPPPPGIVVADESDPAWPAALALAAGHAQPIAWVKTMQGIDSAMPLETFGDLADAVEQAAERTGLSWRDLGDQLDGITVCLNAPVKVQMKGSAVVALTDLLGRRADKKHNLLSREIGPRWAWSGQIFGTKSQSAYRAMSSLFLSPKSAWIFDGYPDKPPWNKFDGSAAAAVFRKAGMPVTVEDTPRQSEREWRVKTASGLDAGLILVNTKGLADEFELAPGRCLSGDVPMLTVPSVVHMVHSLSATAPFTRGTVGGRWLERGAYAYAGSVQEPFLNAFVPTPTVATRLISTVPWGAVPRVDVGPAWKIAVFGDPLLTVGPPPPKAEAPAFKGARDLGDEVREAVAKKDYVKALAGLVLMGRDAEAARLSATLLREEPTSVAPMVARAAIMPLYRLHDTASLVRMFALLTRLADNPTDGSLRDALWLACYLEMTTTQDRSMIDVLRTNLRPEQRARDAAELSGPMARLFGRDSALAMLREARDECPPDEGQKRLEEAMRKLAAGRTP
jgi:hypothetical protein